MLRQNGDTLWGGDQKVWSLYKLNWEAELFTCLCSWPWSAHCKFPGLVTLRTFSILFRPLAPAAQSLRMTHPLLFRKNGGPGEEHPPLLNPTPTASGVSAIALTHFPLAHRDRLLLHELDLSTSSAFNPLPTGVWK